MLDYASPSDRFPRRASVAAFYLSISQFAWPFPAVVLIWALYDHIPGFLRLRAIGIILLILPALVALPLACTALVRWNEGDRRQPFVAIFLSVPFIVWAVALGFILR